jgi:lipid-binding SYLF domain-containing protein
MLMEGIMKSLSRLGVIIGLLFTYSVASAAPAPSNQMILINQAERTVDHVRSDPAFATARDMLKSARGILIVPSLVKGGFVFGAEGGNGVLLSRTDDGWTGPAFFTLASASFGLQAGLESAEVVMLVMSDKALQTIESGSLKIGAGGGLTIVNLSAGAEAATPPNLAGDLIIWTSATGLYGGLTLNGSVIKPREQWNKSFYGRPISSQAILAGDVNNPKADPLRVNLESLSEVASLR